MIHVFLLLVYLGTGDSRQLVSGDMYFKSVDDCNYFASRLAKKYGNYSHLSYVDPRDRTTAYCIPKLVNAQNTKVY